MIAFVIFPVEAVRAVNHRFACGGIGIFFQDVLDYGNDPVRTSTTTPAQIANRVVYTSRARMANTLHSVASDCAY
jgi:hypothetical protein